MKNDPLGFDPTAGDRPANPYLFGQALSEPPAFINREPELRRITTSVRADSGGVISLRGDFRIGKTSILRRFERLIQELPEEKRRDLGQRRIECHGFSCEQLSFGRKESIFAQLCSLLGTEAPPEIDAQVAALTTQLDAICPKAHPVFLIDEIGILPRISGAIPLVKMLRSLISQYPVHFVLAGPFHMLDPQMGWCEMENGGSHQELQQALRRLDQVTDKIQVGPFTIGSAIELIRLSENVYGARERSEEDDRTLELLDRLPEEMSQDDRDFLSKIEERGMIPDFEEICETAPAGERVSLRGLEEVILELAGTVPYVVQIVCAQLFDLLYEDPEKKLDEDELAQRLLYLARNPRRIYKGDTNESFLAGEGATLREDRLKSLKQKVYDQLADSYFEPLWSGLLDPEERAMLIERRRTEIRTSEVEWSSPALRLKERGYLRERGSRLWIFSTLFEEFIDRKHPPERQKTLGMLSLRLTEGGSGSIAEASVIPVRLGERVKELVESCAETAKDEPSWRQSQHFFELVAQLLALLAQVAIVAYTTRPDLQRPELNSSLRQRLCRNLSLGTQLEHLKRILSVDRTYSDDALHRLVRSLNRRRNVQSELPENLVGLIHSMQSSQRTHLSLMDFLDVCIQLRNLQSHPENRPSGMRAKESRRLTLKAIFGLHELVSLLNEETRGLTILGSVRIEDGGGDPTPGSIPLAAVFARDRGVTLATPERSDEQELPETPGELYAALVEGTQAGGGMIRLQNSSLVPLIVDGPTLRAELDETSSTILEDSVYILTGTLSGGGLRFAPLGNPGGDRIDIRRNHHEQPLIQRYDALFERLR